MMYLYTTYNIYTFFLCLQSTLCYIESSESCHIISADDDVTGDNNNDVDAATASDEAGLRIRSQHNISQTGTKTGKYFYPLTCAKYVYHTDIMKHSQKKSFNAYSITPTFHDQFL